MSGPGPMAPWTWLWAYSSEMASVTLTVNGAPRTVEVQPDSKLLWLLRDTLGFTGAKYGCGEGQCGACTVLVDGQPVRSCTARVSLMAGRRIETIEGLASGDRLHPLQQAFLEQRRCSAATARRA